MQALAAVVQRVAYRKFPGKFNTLLKNFVCDKHLSVCHMTHSARNVHFIDVLEEEKDDHEEIPPGYLEQ